MKNVFDGQLTHGKFLQEKKKEGNNRQSERE
jgi:hypothetical protein